MWYIKNKIIFPTVQLWCYPPNILWYLKPNVLVYLGLVKKMVHFTHNITTSRYNVTNYTATLSINHCNIVTHSAHAQTLTKDQSSDSLWSLPRHNAISYKVTTDSQLTSRVHSVFTKPINNRRRCLPGSQSYVYKPTWLDSVNLFIVLVQKSPKFAAIRKQRLSKTVHICKLYTMDSKSPPTGGHKQGISPTKVKLRDGKKKVTFGVHVILCIVVLGSFNVGF